MESKNFRKNFRSFFVSRLLFIVFRAPSARAGQLSLQMLIVSSIGLILIMGFVFWTDIYVRNVRREANNAQAFAIAEAGIEYYRWHLAHAPLDFTDGSTSTPPYVHPYYDKSNNT